VPSGKHLRVHEGDRVRAGDRLSEGPVNPHDILRIKGPRAVQEYLLNEVQEVYRLQGVKINDKHIGVIVKQMLQKVRVSSRARRSSSRASTWTAARSATVNEAAEAEGRTPATEEPLLLGITKASLTTQSFVSAASFQETTRVLTDAAIRGAKDDLLGLKENIIIGHLIPAGTGMYRYNDVDVERSSLPRTTRNAVGERPPDASRVRGRSATQPTPVTLVRNSRNSTRKSSPSQREMRLSCVSR
jgi:DNA-directed RNA polymerase subunit beta'